MNKPAMNVVQSIPGTYVFVSLEKIPRGAINFYFFKSIVNRVERNGGKKTSSEAIAILKERDYDGLPWGRIIARVEGSRF